MAELVTQDTKGPRRIAKAAGDFGGGLLLDEESAEGLILALEGELRGEEKLLVGLCRYLIARTGRHKMIMLQKHCIVNMFSERRAGSQRLSAGGYRLGLHLLPEAAFAQQKAGAR